MNCETCKFFRVGEEEGQKRNVIGRCHRMPPTFVTDDVISCFPFVQGKTDWCGEYKATDDDEIEDMYLKARAGV